MFRRVISLFIFLLVAAASFFIFYPEIRVSPGGLHQLILIISALVGVTAIVLPSFSLLLLAVGICVLPMTGFGSVNLFVAAWVLGRSLVEILRGGWEQTAARELYYGLILLLLIFLLGLITSFRAEVDFLLVSAMFEEKGIAGVVDFLRHEYSPVFRALRIFAGYVVAVCFVFTNMLLLTQFNKDSKRGSFEFFRAGLAFGVLAHSVILYGQVKDLHPLFSLNRSSPTPTSFSCFHTPIAIFP